MDTTTYAILMKKIKELQTGGATQEQIHIIVDEYLKANLAPNATLTEAKEYLKLEVV